MPSTDVAGGVYLCDSLQLNPLAKQKSTNRFELAMGLSDIVTGVLFLRAVTFSRESALTTGIAALVFLSCREWLPSDDFSAPLVILLCVIDRVFYPGSVV